MAHAGSVAAGRILKGRVRDAPADCESLTKRRLRKSVRETLAKASRASTTTGAGCCTTYTWPRACLWGSASWSLLAVPL